MLVKDRSGAVLLNRVLKAGETWPVPPRPDLLLTTGNAGGTEIVVDGAPTPSLGGPGRSGGTCRSTPTRSRTAIWLPPRRHSLHRQPLTSSDRGHQ